ncbi:Glycosyl hydrolases family 2 [Fontibacillus panacisegetis]|uniref:Glycosyl hydrolases family 2 n=1 Tax=Fontibacillus panacisegetis TaxID=670482 RepID=A0A1G7JAX5_9BACL|nr:sugar-binding domain-containing protein [Fontibacillus panacisegetis]SDF22043.1 Glycosyl hydrolases family 2 [Fontibacillus panacisegetis]
MEHELNSHWKIAGQGLRTRWAKEVHPQNVLQEYPRPQMIRDEWMNLNGLWEYAITPKETQLDEIKEYDGCILVPFPVESALSGVQKPLKPDEHLWYRRTFSVPKNWEGYKLLLHFGAVDWKTEVWVNGDKAGEHSGGYTPFSFDITSCLTEGENELVVQVWDPTETFLQERGKQTLHPKGLFYTAVSGIWQTVWLEPAPNQHISSFRMVPNIVSKELTIHIDLASIRKDIHYEVEAEAYENGKLISSARGAVGEGLKLHFSEISLWSTETPFLYDLNLRLIEDGHPIDTIRSYFAMRSFTVEQDKQGVKRLFLNGEPLFQHGILDQGYWPDGLYTAPTDEALAHDIEIAKQLGFNMIRKHIKIEPARWYYHCDRLGMIVWQDMINGGGGWNNLYHLIIPNFASSLKVKDNKYKALGRQDKQNRDNYRKELKEMIDALYNVPSIGMWVPFNEAWGQFDAAEIAEWVRGYDPSRPVVHASGWYDQGVGDIKSVHIYFRKLKMPQNIEGRAVVISEYGGYSLMEKGHMWKEGKGFGYKKCRSREALNAFYASLIRQQLKPLISSGVAAAVYTQLTDVETELNGILTYDREFVKLDMELSQELSMILIEGR